MAKFLQIWSHWKRGQSGNCATTTHVMRSNDLELPFKRPPLFQIWVLQGRVSTCGTASNRTPPRCPTSHHQPPSRTLRPATRIKSHSSKVSKNCSRSGSPTSPGKSPDATSERFQGAISGSVFVPPLGLSSKKVFNRNLRPNSREYSQFTRELRSKFGSNKNM